MYSVNLKCPLSAQPMLEPLKKSESTAFTVQRELRDGEMPCDSAAWRRGPRSTTILLVRPFPPRAEAGTGHVILFPPDCALPHPCPAPCPAPPATCTAKHQEGSTPPGMPRVYRVKPPDPLVPALDSAAPWWQDWEGCCSCSGKPS